MRWAPGARIGDYVIERTLSGDELAFVASHVVLPRRVRIAVLRNACDTALREAHVLEMLRHGVPRIFECGTLPDRRPWIATDLVEGATLTNLAIPEAAPFVRDVAAILAHAHARGVVHRNLRPAAIVPGPQPIVLGWGDARVAGLPDAGYTDDGLAYRAPELVLGDTHDARVDVFSLGVTVYEALTGRLPMAVPIARRLPAMPARLADLIDRMLANHPDARPTMAEVRAEAARIADAPVEDVVVEELVQLVELVEVDTPAPERKLRWTPTPFENSPPPAATGEAQARRSR